MDVSRKVAAAPTIIAVVSLLIIGAVVLTEATRQEPTTVITVDSLRPDWDPADLVAEADAIAILEPTGPSDVHWNSADRRAWVADANAQGPWIYRDDRMQVKRLIRGSLPSTLDLRGVGGTVGDVRMDYEGQIDWQEGREYLVLLEREQTPTKEGFEEMWTVLHVELGVFVAAGDGRWVGVTTGDPIQEATLQ